MYKLTQSEKTVHRTIDNAFIPFDGSNRDYQEYLQWLAEGNQPEPYIPPPPPVPQSITRRQCAIELRERQLITPTEALNMTKYGDVPSMISQVFSSMTSNDRIIAETDFAADTYERTNPLLIQIMTSTGASEEDIDQFFRDAVNRTTNSINISNSSLDQIKQDKITSLTTEKNNLIAQFSEPYDAAEIIYIEMIETQLTETISQINNSQSEEEINTITIQWIQFGV